MLFKFGVVQHNLAMGGDVTVPMTFEVTESEVIALIVSVSSCLIGITGGLSNLASLLYFITRAEKSLSRQIFIMLNSFDLLVCTSVVPSVLLYFCKATLCGFSQLPFRVSFAFFNLGIECTALSTCLLGVLRFIAIRFPYHQVKKKVLVSVTISFILLEVLREVLRIYFFFFDRSNLVFYLKFHNAAMISVLTLAVVINSISSILLTCHLLRSSKRSGSGIRNNSFNQKFTSKSRHCYNSHFIDLFPRLQFPIWNQFVHHHIHTARTTGDQTINIHDVTRNDTSMVVHPTEFRTKFSGLLLTEERNEEVCQKPSSDPVQS